MKKSIGTVVWYFGTRIIAQETMFEGEQPEDTRERAKKSLELIDRDNSPYFNSQYCKPVLYRI